MTRRPHWLTVSSTGTTPTVLLTFDTETNTRRELGTEIMTLRCWDALVRIRRHGGLGGFDTEAFQGETPGGLVDVLESAADLTGEVWAFAHNLGFDLTVTNLPAILVERGWEVGFMSIGDESAVFVFSRDGQKLCVMDSWSWLRCPLERAATDVAMRKVPLPLEGDSLERWHQRCAHDVKILDHLLCELMAWWDAQALGQFGLTGAACGWRTLKGKIAEKQILVGVEQPRTERERRAIYGGRKEVWRVGQIRGAWIEDWDIASAYLTTAAFLPLPRKPLSTRAGALEIDPLNPPEGISGLSEVQITTIRPIAPARVGNDVYWPVGTFRTLLTTPELQLVAEHAEKIKVIDTSWYLMSDDLGRWGRWCLNMVNGPGDEVPKVVRRVAKGWGRSVPGRFALRKPTLISERPATHLGWALETGVDLESGCPIEVLTFGGVERTYRKDQDGADVSPIVLAFVEGYVRAAMARTLEARDPAQLLQCNTDGWWETRAGRDPGAGGAAVPHPYRAVRKAVTREVNVYGPNHTDAANDQRLAGVPRNAERKDDGSFHWQDWPGLRWQLENSRPGEYQRPGRSISLAPHYCRRWVLTSGETVPPSAQTSRSGVNSLLPWSQTLYRRPSDELAEHQVPALLELADAEPWRASPRPPSLPHLPGRLAPSSSAA